MPFDLSKLARVHDFELHLESLGSVRCTSASVKTMSALAKLLEDPKIPGTTLARQLLGLVATKAKQDEIATAAQSPELKLTAAELALVTDDEVEVFAAEFLRHNDWLLKSYEGAERDVRTNEKGEQTVSIRPLPVDFPREEGESSSTYLVRVIRRYQKEHQDRMAKVFSSWTGGGLKSVLTASTQDAIRQNLSASDRLRETLRSFDRDLGHIGPTIADIVPPTFDQGAFVPPENPAHETNRRLNRLIAVMEDSQPIISSSADLLRTMNDALVRMQGDFIKSSRRNEIYTRIAVSIAAVGLCVTAWFSWWSYSFSQQQAASEERRALVRHDELRILNEAADKRIEALALAMQRDESVTAERNRQALISALRDAIRTPAKEQKVNKASKQERPTK